MEIKTLRANIAVNYLGCLVKGEGNITGVLAGIFTTHNTCNIELPDRSISVGHLLYECQLILTPLSKITDEHAAQVAAILDLQYSNVDDTYFMDLHAFSRYLIDMLEGENRFGDKISLAKMREAIDLLRSLHYDCGYGSINSLIKYGLALNASTIQNQI